VQRGFSTGEGGTSEEGPGEGGGNTGQKMWEMIGRGGANTSRGDTGGEGPSGGGHERGRTGRREAQRVHYALGSH